MLNRIESTTTAKIFTLICLVALLWLALGRVMALSDERESNRDEAAAELARSWTGPQELIGPVIIVPVVESWTELGLESTEEKPVRIAKTRDTFRYVYPKSLSLDAQMLPQERWRGIFKVPFYTLDGEIKGSFDASNLRAMEEDPSKYRSKPSGPPMIAMALSDIRGLQRELAVTIGGQSLVMRKQLPKLVGLPNGMYAELPAALLEQLRKGGSLDWRMPIELLGQKQLEVAPVADITQVHLRSPWPHPSFGGHFLPGERTVTSAGFDATWKVSSFSGAVRSQFESRRGERGAPHKEGLPDAFNVKLIEPLDVYALSTRATKYGLLFITLTLAAVFMFEVLAQLQLHPVQYGLVGLSIALFFLLLLALSEKLAFGIAYAVAASGSVALLAIYFSAVLRRVTRGLSLAAGVALLYAALYGLLMSEDNALLLGALLLFGTLAAFMVGTRRVNWYALGDGNRRADDAPKAV